MLVRPRRNRKSAYLRDLVQENYLSTKDLVMPLFVVKGTKQKQSIPSMPNMYRFSIDLLLKECEKILNFGIRAIALFPYIEKSLKDNIASESYNPKGLFAKAISEIKKTFSELIIISDLAMDPYSSDGHDGLLIEDKIVNDKSLEILAKMALCQAQAGTDIVAPSDMMDGRVKFIRNALDKQNFTNIGILSYTAKYASSFYTPFREALDSVPQKGDKKTYQMNYGNGKEALRELKLDIEEGADIVMVKPAFAYLDIVKIFSQNTFLPVAVYNVSGEYNMIEEAIRRNLFPKEIILEILTSFKRAGASIIFSYHSLQAAKLLKSN